MNGFDAPGSAESSDDLWYVQLPSGAVRLMTLDELDTFFNEGIIDERAHVRRDGSSAWHTLAEVAGLDEQETIAPTFTPPPVSVMPNSIRPVAFDVADLELDLDLAPARSTSSKKRFMAYGVLLGAVAAGVFVAASRYGLPGNAPTVAQAAIAPVAPAPAKETTPVAAVAPAAGPTAPATSGARLSESQKQALLSADKERAAQQAERAKARRVLHRAKGSGPVFHKGGNKYDPLNSKL